MDLTNVKAYTAITQADEDVAVGPGDQFLGAGSWLYSAPHPDVKRLVDVLHVEGEEDWVKIEHQMVRISAATPLGWLAKYQWPEHLRAGAVFPVAIQGVSASFKVIQRASVGGNIALSLAKGAIGPICVAMDAEYVLVSSSGTERIVTASDFQTGSMCNVLRPGERVAAVLIPEENMDADWALKRIRMTTTSHVATSVIGLKYPSGKLRINFSATLVYPVALQFESMPENFDEIEARVDAELPQHPYMEDQHGTARYRHAMARNLASEVFGALSQGLAQ
ncbi:MAG: FAD binding domain-containing protein [Verrucomicrobiota bacterium]